MNIEESKKILDDKPGLATTIGMEFISTPEPDTCMAKMPVDDRNIQPFGYLSGGATLALAETLAGVGSCSLCPGTYPMGMTVNSNHMHAAKKGDTVTATARIIHQGKTTHVWQVEVRNEAGEMISNISVTNYIVRP